MTHKHKLSQREVWLLMAEHWRADRIAYMHGVVGSCLQTGLCNCAAQLLHFGVITLATYRVIIDRLGMQDGGFRWPRTTRGAQARRRFCLRMAREVKE